MTRRHGPERCDRCYARAVAVTVTRLFSAVADRDIDITMTELLDIAEDTFGVRLEYRLVER